MKAQIFSMDFAFALSIFFAILFLVMYFWVIIPTYSGYGLQKKTNTVVEYLLLNKLASNLYPRKDNFLNCSAITELNSQTYSSVKATLGSPYDFFVKFNNNSAVCSGASLNIGYNLTNKTYTTSIVRLVSLDNQTMQMVAMFYE